MPQWRNLLVLVALSFLPNPIQSFSAPTPIDPTRWPSAFPAKDHCSRCGLCETTLVSHVMDACAFVGPGMSRIDDLEVEVHGRRRKDDLIQDKTGPADEGRFGVLHQPIMLAKGTVKDAQWTGVVSGIAISMLERDLVDAVVCIASEDDTSNSTANDTDNESKGAAWSQPKPIIARTVQEVLRGRGVKPALAPSLAVLDEVRADPTIQRLLFCGVGCAVQAFRSIEHTLTLEEVYVLGTNCADNSPTPQAAQKFMQDGVGIDPTTVQGYEFSQDYRVHVKTTTGYETKPYFCLPGSIAEEAIATSCLACFDYTNALADVVVGYMGAPLNAKMGESYQTLTVRNGRGAAMVDAAVDANRLEIGRDAEGAGSHEQLAMATVVADSIVLGMTGGNIPQQGMPRFVGEAVAFVLSNFVGPKGINFARYSIDYHLLRNYLHVIDVWGEERAQTFLPQYARDIVERYLGSDEKLPEIRDSIIAAKNVDARKDN